MVTVKGIKMVLMSRKYSTVFPRKEVKTKAYAARILVSSLQAVTRTATVSVFRVICTIGSCRAISR